MLTTFYPPYHFGGDAIATQRLARALVRAGHAVTVVHDIDAYHALHSKPPNESHGDHADGADGVEVIGLRSGLGALSPLLTQQIGRPVVHGRRIKGLLESRRFDVINFHNISLIGGPGILGYGGQAVRLYMAHEHWLVCPTHVLWRHDRELCSGRECFRCTLAYRRPPQLWRATGFLERQLDHVDAFIAMSEFSRAKHREFGFPREMDVLPQFLPDTPQLDAVSDRSPHPRPYFLFVGRLESIKGLDDVLPAFGGGEGPDLLVAGEGSHGAALRAAAQSSPRIKFLGSVNEVGLQALYRHALALVVPSIVFETFGLVVIEAFRAGVPVIARQIGPLPELVEQARGGLLFSTPEELRAALRTVASDPTRRMNMGAAARRAYLSRWSEDVVVPAYLGLVDRAAARRNRPAVTPTLRSGGVACAAS
jgi:glycosyltransferase involved in cell wall biosynthesis